MLKQCSCLIPFYNEGERILPVIKVMVTAKNISEVICIDDGSTDGAASIIPRNLPKVRIIRLRKNLGKAQAIAKGLKFAKGEYILLSDGDLWNIKKNEIEKAVETIMKSPSIDMIILRRLHELRLFKIYRGDIIFSGERLLKKRDLRELLKSKPSGYQIEVAINQYMMEKRKKVYWMPESSRHTLKIEKIGVLPGIFLGAKMNATVIDFIGLKNMTKQITSFCRYPPEEHTDSLKL